MEHLNLYKPNKIWYVDVEHYESFREVAFVAFYGKDKFLALIEDNEPTKFLRLDINSINILEKF